MYNTRVGHNQKINARNYSTMGVHKGQPQNTAFKPEYQNNHMHILNDFGFSCQQVTNKTFVNPNCANTQIPSYNKITNSTITPNKGTGQITSAIFSGCFFTPFIARPLVELCNNLTRMHLQTELATHLVDKCESVCDSTNVNMKPSDAHIGAGVTIIGDNYKSQQCTSKKFKKSKKNKMRETGKSFSKKLKHTRKFHKHSKREADRAMCGDRKSQKGYFCRNKKFNKADIVEDELQFDISNEFNGDTLSPSPLILKKGCISFPILSLICQKKGKAPLKHCAGVENDISNKSGIVPVAVKETETKFTTGLPVRTSFKPRLPSECESEDSFIVFEDNFDTGDTDISEDEGFSDSESELSDKGTDTSDSEDVTDCSFLKRPEHIRCWNLSLSPLKKKVTFAHDTILCEVHPMVKWSFAYQEARKGPWEQYARDRERFKKRVQDTEPILSTILQMKHRDRVYNSRFSLVN